MGDNFFNEFSKKVAGYSDDELIEVLKNRSHYKGQAAQLAVKEALKRGIIRSEADLPEKEYEVKPSRFTIFPPVKNAGSREQLIRSLARSVLLTGVIPLIFGFIKISGKDIMEGIVLLLLGIIWILASAMVLRKLEEKFVYVVLFICFLSFFYVYRFFSQVQLLRVTDMFIAIVIYGLVFYCLLYIRSLLKIRD
ncbi:hypothetical protein MNBD_BACTEROID01-514 [hydrothermal vent metagenome]|uniref:Uncharacterized protein n=1 Tax=hydrothermal vent metagenome TaxID=652676 RepID=A0A3B0U0F0_9ZZZZ